MGLIRLLVENRNAPEFRVGQRKGKQKINEEEEEGKIIEKRKSDPKKSLNFISVLNLRLTRMGAGIWRRG